MAEAEQILEHIDPNDNSKLAAAIHLATERAQTALGEIRARVQGFDSKYQATERAAALLQPMIEQASKAFDDLAKTATKIQSDLKESAVVEPVQVPVKAISHALARANATLEAIVMLAKQYDAKFKLTESLVTLIAPHQERVCAAISHASSHATASAEAATSQLRGVHAAITEKGLTAAAASMVTQLVAAQASSLDERFAITEQSQLLITNAQRNMEDLAQRTTHAAQSAQTQALTKVADNVTAIAGNSNVLAASDAVRTAVEAVEARFGVTGRMAALDERVTGGKATGWAAAAFSRGLSMASGVLSYATTPNTVAPNAAFVFIKPHAVTDAVKGLVRDGLAAQGVTVLSEGSISSEEIDEKKLIDQHYYAIASKATILQPHQLNVPADKFEGKFGLTWQAALDSGKVFNAMDGCTQLGIDADEMDKQWGICKKANKLIKFGGGFYCGLIEMEGQEPIYVFNGFFMSMRSKFTAPGKSIYYYLVEFDQQKVGWEDFRQNVLGPTDPTDAPAGSLRGQIFSRWEELGLSAVPDVGDNGVHASASPFEALAERVNWVGASLADDVFGKTLLQHGISEHWVRDGCVDPQVVVDIEGNRGSLFDALEDMDADDCVAKVLALYKYNTEEAGSGAAAEEEQEGVRGSSTHVDLSNLKDSGTGELTAEEFAALRAKTKSAAEVNKNMTAEQQAEYGCKTGVAASAVRPDSDDSDDEGADFQMGAEGQGALLADY